MKRFAALVGVGTLGVLASQAGLAYNVTATVNVSFGGNAASGQPNNVTGVTDNGSGTGTIPLPYSTTADLGWTSNGTNTLSTVANNTYFTTLGGYNSLSYYNPNFASASQCATIVAGLNGSGATTRKYGCRYNTYSGTPSFVNTPVIGAGPVGGAAGTITVTDTTMTGTLTIVSTTDVPSGATTTISPSGVRLSGSVGNGANGYNLRSADGSPFGNYWQGITTAGTYTLNLTGTFNATSWNITGGVAGFIDPGFMCQQGGLGSTSDPTAGTLCTDSTAAGGQQKTGANLSWGWDIDGIGTNTAITEIDVRDAAGSTTISTLSGVLASLSVDGSGNITTNSGEWRRGLGSAGGGCGDHIRYNGTKIACGTLTTGLMTMTGTVAAVPAPAAGWLLATGVGLLGARRKFAKKA